jgi:hypothetical protein
VLGNRDTADDRTITSNVFSTMIGPSIYQQ